jgi:cytochrome c biogenesis protein CcdA
MSKLWFVFVFMSLLAVGFVGAEESVSGAEDAKISSVFGELTLGVVVVSALVDSINPCALGVLLFLMAVLLSMGSSKRAFRAAMIYTFVIFLVYLFLGLGIRQLISFFSILNYVQIIAGAIILAGGLIELKDFFWEGRGFSLKIPSGTKPLLEKYIRKGTLPAIILLGVLVALVELPCTGGIYLGILGLVSTSEVSGIFYLLIYNFIFVLPLIVVALMIRKGTHVTALSDWVQNNKKYMRLAAGVIMIFLALKLLGVF